MKPTHKMKTGGFGLLAALVMFLLLVGCQNGTTQPETPQKPESSPSPDYSNLPGPQVRTTNIPPARSVALAYLEAWKVEDYPAMYALLSEESKANLTAEDFQKKYQSAADESALNEIRIDPLGEQQDGVSLAQFRYRVTLASNLVGDLTRETAMKLSFEDGAWRVLFDDEMILPELAAGGQLRMDLNPPVRAPIYDRNGRLLAGQTDATSIGLYPSNIDPENSDGLYGLLSRASGLSVAEVISRVENAAPGDYLAFGQLETQGNGSLLNALSSWGAVSLTNYTARYYPGNGIAPHLVGYVRALDPEELSKFRRRGYRVDEKVGRKGIERWGEDVLVGQHGGILYQLDSTGVPVAELGSAASTPGQAIYTTFDAEFQQDVQEALRGFRAAAVVIEQNTGRILALASSPGFDQNSFQVENYNSWVTLPGLVSDVNLPEFNRASQGLYPLGSVFKVITMAAALESGLFPDNYTYDCQYEFTELPGLTLYDWTYEHFLEDGETPPTGQLNSLSEALMRSCNPLFWHLGKGLFDAGKPTAISDMARAFGLGAATGIGAVEEQAGVIPDPPTVVDAVNIAIGQGDVQVTPLQVARFMAALGNGGTLYRPQAIEKIVAQDGTSTFEFEPEITGSLPLKPETLETLKQAMIGVLRNRQPRGTAYLVFNGYNVPIAGKTGTATSQSADPHAWFAGYTMNGRTDKPDIAIAVVAENAGEGSEIAAPIFRRIVELYFQGRPGKLYPWEASYGVTKTPTSIYTETPVPEEEANP